MQHKVLFFLVALGLMQTIDAASVSINVAVNYSSLLDNLYSELADIGEFISLAAENADNSSAQIWSNASSWIEEKKEEFANVSASTNATALQQKWNALAVEWAAVKTNILNAISDASAENYATLVSNAEKISSALAQGYEKLEELVQKLSNVVVSVVNNTINDVKTGVETAANTSAAILNKLGSFGNIGIKLG